MVPWGGIPGLIPGLGTGMGMEGPPPTRKLRLGVGAAGWASSWLKMSLAVSVPFLRMAVDFRTVSDQSTLAMETPVVRSASRPVREK